MGLCKHLKPIQDFELNKGNEILEISKGWSNALYVVDLKKQISFDLIYTSINLSKSVVIWENKDNHYRLQKGFYCNKCKHSIAGPI